MTRQPYACDPARSRGRRQPQSASVQRTEFQRDRDRIVHSTAFRRLVYKTQVFINHEGDLFRTRLTHSLEVAQLARSMARALGLDEDLVEAISLAHDLGHTPFGHAGQDALHRCMTPYGGFEHNLQSLRVVDFLEQRYADFDGLNLCFETREGILKRCALNEAQRLEVAEPGGVGRRFLAGTQPSLEAQLVNLADEIAYNAHDVDDGIRSGLLAPEEIEAVPLFARHLAAAENAHPGLRERGGRRWLFETIRRLLTAQVDDLTATTRALIAEHKPSSADAARQAPPLVRFSDAMRSDSSELTRTLFRSLYRHPQVMATTATAATIITDLFNAYLSRPRDMSPEFARASDRPRAVADYIAGMTDRYAAREHERLTGRPPFL